MDTVPVIRKEQKTYLLITHFNRCLRAEAKFCRKDVYANNRDSIILFSVCVYEVTQLTVRVLRAHLTTKV